VALADRLGVTADRAGFAGVSEEGLLDALGGRFAPLEEPTAETLLAMSRGLGGLITFGPVVDGDLHTGTVDDGLRAGAGRDVPLLMGCTRDEFSGLARAHRDLFDRWDPEVLLGQLGVDAEVAARYVATLPGWHAGDVLGRYTTDLVFRRHVPAWTEARRGAPGGTWAYDFAWPSTVAGIAGHCLDVPFVFDVLTDEHVARLAGPDAPQSLADAVHGSVVAFVRGGSPGWSPFDQDGGAMVFDDPSRTESGTYDSARVLVR
jgi:para-nitrobenzyl esterase